MARSPGPGATIPAASPLTRSSRYRRPRSAKLTPKYCGRAGPLTIAATRALKAGQPTPNYTEFESFNTCVSGGRVRGDLALSKISSVYAWAGYYESFAESVANDECRVSRDTRNRILDSATGLELHSDDRRSKAEISIGSRFTFVSPSTLKMLLSLRMSRTRGWA